MQTILRIVCNDRSLSDKVDDFIVRFCAKASGEAPLAGIPAPHASD